MSYRVMDDELVKEAIVYWDDCVNKLQEGDITGSLYQQIVNPPQQDQGRDGPDGYLVDDEVPPKKNELAERCEYQHSTISDQREISADEKFGEEMSPWEAFSLVGLVDIYETPNGHMVSRNEGLCEIKRNDEIRRKNIFEPRSAPTKAEAEALEKKRLLASRFGLNLLHRYDPETLGEYAAEMYPSAYIGTPQHEIEPREVLMAVKAEIGIPATPEAIEVQTEFEKDKRRTSNSRNYWQMINKVTLELSDITPVSSIGEIKRYLREETNRILQVAVTVDDFEGCNCGTIKSHTRAAYGGLLIGGRRSPETETEPEKTNRECTLASNQEPLIDTNLTEGKVHYTATWDGIRGSES